jgi:Peptidase M15
MAKTVKIPGISKPVPLTRPIHATKAPNFSWGEVTHGGTRQLPSGKEVQGAIDTAIELQKIRNAIGKALTITSWYRDPVTNRNVGGASQSQHMTGRGVDFRVEGYTGKQLYELLDKMYPDKYGIGFYGKSRASIVHFDSRPGKPGRWFHE